jgi:hypothetical protein
MIINRNLFKVKLQDTPFSIDEVKEQEEKLLKNLDIKASQVSYFVFEDKVSNQAYTTKNPIKILLNENKAIDIVSASDQLNLQALTKPVEKYYLCYPKKM